jgi:uncharacterized protein
LIVDADAYVGSFWPGSELVDGRPDAVRARLEAMGVEVAFAALMEGAWYRDQRRANDQLADMVHAHRDFFRPLACIDPTASYAEEELTRCIDALDMRGVRLFPTYHHYRLDNPRVATLAHEAGRRRIPVFVTLMMEEDRFAHPAVAEMPLDKAELRDMTAVHLAPGLGSSLLRPLAALIASAPDSTFVVGMASVDQAHALLSLPMMCDGRVFFDIARMDRPTTGLDMLIGKHGAASLVFGSHAPFLYPEATLLNLAYRTFSGEHRQAILAANWTVNDVLQAVTSR